MNTRRTSAFFVLGNLFILGLALWLRGRHLGAASFWFDEVYSANLVTFRTSLRDVIDRVAALDAHPPAHYVLSWFWAKAVGIWGTAYPSVTPGIEWKLRALSVLTGLGSLYIILVVWRQWLGNALALLIGLWIAVSPVVVAQDREARMYPLLTLFLVLTVTFLARYIDRPSMRNAVLLAGSLVGCIYTQYLGFFIWAGVALGLAVSFRRQRAWTSLIALGLPLLLFVPWLSTFSNQLLAGRANTAIRGDPDGVFGIGFWEIITVGPSVDAGWFRYAVFPLFWLLVSVGAIGTWRGIRNASVRPKAVGAAALTFAGLWPFMLWYASSLWLVNTASLRYLGVFALPLLGLCVLGVSDARSWVSRFRRPLRGPMEAIPLLVVLLLIGVSASGIGAGRLGQHEPWREVAAFLGARVQPGDQVLVNEPGRLMSLLYYYRPGEDIKMYVPAAGQLEDALEKPSIWVVVRLFGTPYLLPDDNQGVLDAFLLARENQIVDFGAGVVVIHSEPLGEIEGGGG